MGKPVSRRTAIGLGLAGLAGVTGVAGMAGLPGARRILAQRDSPDDSDRTVAGWVRSRRQNYFIAHRGSGDVLPEHSLPAYRAAVGWGARCMEVSVGITSDGVLVCIHDPTYDRTTTGSGTVSEQPSSVLDRIGILQPQLGPAWTRPPLPRVPLLETVLTELGREAVICLEAKVDEAYEPMMALVDRLGLRDQIVVKAYSPSRRIEQAKRDGFPVFGYVAIADLEPEMIAGLAARLDPASDYLVVPATVDGDLELLPDDLLAGIVGHGVPVWVYPVHRRHEAQHYFERGVSGAICSSYGYVARAVPPATSDTWASKAIAPGEMTRRPADPTLAPQWTGADELLLALRGRQHFLTLGQLSPVERPADPYSVSFDASWRRLPRDLGSNLTLAFGHADDGYYQHRLGRGTGYHALSRPDGRLELFAHTDGVKEGRLLAAATAPPVVEGQWMSFRLDVAPDRLTWTRTDAAGAGTTVTARNEGMPGGYLHVGRGAADMQAELALRHLVVG